MKLTKWAAKPKPQLISKNSQASGVVFEKQSNK